MYMYYIIRKLIIKIGSITLSNPAKLETTVPFFYFRSFKNEFHTNFLKIVIPSLQNVILLFQNFNLFKSFILTLVFMFIFMHESNSQLYNTNIP